MTDDTKKVVIGIDVGTQSTKAVLYHPSSHTIKARAGCPYDLDDTPPSIPSRKEQHPHKWIRALHICLHNLSTTIQTEKYVVAGIGVSGQQHGMVPLDDTFHVIRSAKLWCDVEASEEAKEFSEQAAKVMNMPWSIPAGFTAPKVSWMKRNEPELFEKVRWIVLPHDYVNLCLETGIGHDYEYHPKTNPEGEDVFTYVPRNENVSLFDCASYTPKTDAGDASGTGILHPSKPEYVPALAQLIHDKYDSYLPQIIAQPNAVYGNLSAQWKKAVNIDVDDTYAIPISVGSGDNMMSALGSTLQSGNAVLSLGTSGTIFGVSDTPVKTGTPVAPFRDASGKYLPLVCTMSCTGVINAVREQWCSSSSSSSSSTSANALTHAEAMKLAKDVPPGCHGLTFLPFIGGERTPDWPHSTGALLGITPHNMNCMSNDENKSGIMYRAALEGVTYLLKDALEQMRESCGSGFDPQTLYVVGGGSKNQLWRQMIADVLQLELKFPLEPESAALGAAFQAGAAASHMAVDEYVSKQKIAMEEDSVIPTDDQTTIKLYNESYERYKTNSRKLFA